MILTVIKCIGIVLLSLLILILLFLILPLPVRAGWDLSEERKTVTFSIRTFLGLLSAQGSFEGELKGEVRALWGLIRVYDSSAPKKEKKKKKKEKGKKVKVLEKLKRAGRKIPAVKSLFQKKKDSISRFLKSLSLSFSRGSDLTFSTGSPDTTGILTGILSFFPFLYGRGLKVQPDFGADQAFIRGQGTLKGHIIPMKVLILIILIIKEAEFKTIIN